MFFEILFQVIWELSQESVKSNNEGGIFLWQTKHSYAKIATLNLFSRKTNRHSTRKKVLKTNPRDALLAEKQESSRETTMGTEIQPADGRISKRAQALFFLASISSIFRNILKFYVLDRICYNTIPLLITLHIFNPAIFDCRSRIKCGMLKTLRF